MQPEIQEVRIMKRVTFNVFLEKKSVMNLVKLFNCKGLPELFTFRDSHYPSIVTGFVDF